MQFFTIAVAVFASVASAMPAQNQAGPKDISEVTVKQAADVCGSNNTLQCCNKAKATGDTKATGVLAGLLGGDEPLNLFGQCSKVNLLINDILNKQCQQTAACCQGNEVNQDGSLIGIGCIPISNLL